MADKIAFEYLDDVEAYKLSFPQGFYILVTKEFALTTPSATLLDLINYLSKATIPTEANHVKVDSGNGDGKLLMLEIHWPKPIKFNPPQISKMPHIPELIMPGIKQLWHEFTGSSHNLTMEYYPYKDLFRLSCDGEVVLSIPKHLIEDDQYGKIREMVIHAAKTWVDKHPQQLPATAVMKLADATNKAEKYAKFAAMYGSPSGKLDQLMKALQPPPPPKPKAKPIVKELHVFDLGDGMLVPCEMVHELAVMFKQPAHQQMSKSDFFGTLPKVAKPKPADSPFKELLKAMGMAQYAEWFNDDFDTSNLLENKPMIVHDSKVSKESLKKEMELYPGKVMIMDDISPYVTDLSSWFTLPDEMNDVEFIQGKYYGKSIAEFLTEPQPVAIPKNPKQITKSTLEHFHKLLGGKKSPFKP